MIIPFTYPWIIKKIVKNPRTVLDIGCGDGELMSVICDPSWEITGIDIYKKSLDLAKSKSIYSVLVKGEVINECQKLVKQKKKYDLVFCSQLIEHITKKDGERLISLMQKLASKIIFISTPRGYVDQYDKYLELNPFHEHLSGWTVEDFNKLGFRVVGIGSNLVWSEKGIARTENKLKYILGNLISYVMSPVSYYYPNTAAGIFAFKKINEVD